MDISLIEMSPEERFRELFDLYFHRVRGYALRRTERLVDADDAVAEVFTIAWRRLEDVPTGPTANAWLLAVARRVVANQRRGATRRARLIERLEREPTAARRPDAVDESGPVAAAFAALTETDREVLGLAYWEGLSPAEIALVLGISASGARVKLHRARRRLANRLAAMERGYEPGRPPVRSPLNAEEA